MVSARSIMSDGRSVGRSAQSRSLDMATSLEGNREGGIRRRTDRRTTRHLQPGRENALRPCSMPASYEAPAAAASEATQVPTLIPTGGQFFPGRRRREKERKKERKKERPVIHPSQEPFFICRVRCRVWKHEPAGPYLKSGKNSPASRWSGHSQREKAQSFPSSIPSRRPSIYVRTLLLFSIRGGQGISIWHFLAERHRK